MLELFATFGSSVIEQARPDFDAEKQDNKFRSDAVRPVKYLNSLSPCVPCALGGRAGIMSRREEPILSRTASLV
jgi:hypothetical protein